MIIYRPIAPLTTGRPGLKSTLAAMALTAVLGTVWQDPNDSSGAPSPPRKRRRPHRPTGMAGPNREHHRAGAADRSVGRSCQRESHSDDDGGTSRRRPQPFGAAALRRGPAAVGGEDGVLGRGVGGAGGGTASYRSPTPSHNKPPVKQLGGAGMNVPPTRVGQWVTAPSAAARALPNGAGCSSIMECPAPASVVNVAACSRAQPGTCQTSDDLCPAMR